MTLDDLERLLRTLLRYEYIFVGFTWRGGIKWCLGCQKGDFYFFESL